MLRMGDFYEMFYQDAVTAARELEITLTSRGKDEKKAALAGIPLSCFRKLSWQINQKRLQGRYHRTTRRP